MTILSRRSALAAIGFVAFSGCTPTAPVVPGAPPTPNASAMNALNTINAAEAIAMTAIRVACGGSFLPAPDCLAADAADKAYQAVASTVGADIAAGKPLTAVDVGDALSAVLAAVTALHAKAATAKLAAAKK